MTTASKTSAASLRAPARVRRKYDRMVDTVPWLSRVLSFFWGALYAALGIIGLSLADLSLFSDPAGGGYILGLRVNGLAAVIYLLVGLTGIACSMFRKTADRCLRYLCLFGIVLFLAAIFMSTNPQDNWIAANGYVIGLGVFTSIGAVW